MNKFKVGDEVVCIEDEYSDLTIGKLYKIIGARCFGDEYYLEGEPFSWMESRFELFSEWAAHQVPVNTETELSLTKIQVEMLQDWKKAALYLLSKTSHEDMIPTTLREEIDYFLDNNKLEGFDE